MILEILYSLAALYLLVAVFAVLYVSFRIAKPPWHQPNPGGNVLTHNHLPPSWKGATTPTELHLPYLDVSFLSYANLTLRGWLIPSAHACRPSQSHQTQYHAANILPPAATADPAARAASQVAVACIHGAGRDRRAFLRHSAFLSRAGYDVLLFDCANHGTSDSLPAWPYSSWPGRAVTLGKREYLDVNAAINFLRSRGAQSVVLLGTSQGASSAIVATAKFQNADLLLLENPFVSPDKLIAGIVDVVLQRISFPAFKGLFRAPIVWLSLLRTGNVPRDQQMRAADFIGLVEVPTLFIHGTADVMVRHTQSEELFRKVAHQKKDIWLVKDAAHTQCCFKEPELFQEKVLRFIRSHLGDRLLDNHSSVT